MGYTIHSKIKTNNYNNNTINQIQLMQITWLSKIELFSIKPAIFFSLKVQIIHILDFLTKFRQLIRPT